jgi:hypothetical protein
VNVQENAKERRIVGTYAGRMVKNEVGGISLDPSPLTEMQKAAMRAGTLFALHGVALGSAIVFLTSRNWIPGLVVFYGAETMAMIASRRFGLEGAQ